MPSVSKTQQRLMGQALAYKRGEIKDKDLNPQYADEIKKLAKSMTEKQLKDFASTKHKNLPEKVKESNVMSFDSFNEAHKQINHKDQKLSKDMKKQSHVSSKKPSNKKLSSEDHLAETPKKGQYREPSNKKLSSEEFLAKDHKLTHIKEFNRFINENIEELSPEDKEKIDSMSHRELAYLWRHGSSDNKLFHGAAGEYMKDRLFKHFGGFNSNLSKDIGW